MNLLVTGGAGFIGSNFIRYMLNKYCNYHIVNLDLLTYAGNMENLKDIENNPNYVFIQGDVRNHELLKKLFMQYQINTVIHFAAETHVDRSIMQAKEFLDTNTAGTAALLDTVKEYISKRNHFIKYIQISTDEVYGSIEIEGKFLETSPVVPRSPYSASKASADLFVLAYHTTYGIPVNITRCSNNFGPFQFPEKLIPLVIYNCLHNKKIPVYGDGLQIRDWIYVMDHCRAIDAVLHHGKNGEIYNIGSNQEKTNIDIIHSIVKEMNREETLITHVKDRPGHDRRYAIDNTKLKMHTGWKPIFPLETALYDTIHWYCENVQWLENTVEDNFKQNYKNMYENS